MKDRNPIKTLLNQAGSEEMPLLPLLFDLARNIANLSRLGGPKVGMVPSADGRALQTSLVNFLNFFADRRLSTSDDRQKLRPGAAHFARPGQRFDLDAWLQSTIILMKLAQTEAIAKRRTRLSIVSRYLERPGRWHNPEGVGEEQVRAWRKKDLLRKHLFNTELTMRITALAVPADLDGLSLSEQLAYMRGLGERAKDLFEPMTDNLFPAEALWLLFDFSLHKDAELKDFLVALRSYREESLQDRLLGLTKDLTPALVEIQDLFPGKMPPQNAPMPIATFLGAIREGAPAWFLEPQGTSLLGMILPVAGAVDETPKASAFESRFDEMLDRDSVAAWIPLQLR